jgi:hypothetical protein
MEVRPGIYQHYKNKEYAVIGIAAHSESGEELVVYRPLYGERKLWVRPREMFLGTVIIDGREVPRFKYIRGCSAVDAFVAGMPEEACAGDR